MTREEQTSKQLENLLKDLNDHEDEQFNKYPDLDPELFAFALMIQATAIHRCSVEGANFKELVDQLSDAWALFDEWEKGRESD